VDLVGDPSWIGKSVLADLDQGSILPVPCPAPATATTQTCGVQLKTGEGTTWVDIGIRDSTSSDGVQEDDGNGYRWVRQLAIPNPPGLFAFAIQANSLTYLGPAHLGENG